MNKQELSSFSIQSKRNSHPVTPAPPPISDERLEKVSSWGGASHTMGWVYRPTSAEGVAELFNQARSQHLKIGLRGGGNSYGDAACNEGGIVLDLTRFKRILDWNPQTGVITVEPGLKLRELWEYVLEDGWWPPVCTGTMEITIGGGAAMNVHGKNAYKVGTLGDNILAFDLMLPDGTMTHCNRTENSDLFHAAIGGFGVLGCFTRITLQMKRVYSGLLDVSVHNSRNLNQIFQQFDDLSADSDYLVGWIDCAASGKSLGRGEIHRANYLPKGIDPYPQQTLNVKSQHLGDTLFGIVPRSAMWRFMQPFFNSTGVPWVNRGKYWSSYFKDGISYRQPHAQFHFLLNYFPDWKKATGRGGLIQYQPFVPTDRAEETFAKILTTCQQHRLVPYLGVFKQHKADPFWMTHGLDGFSLALDFRVTPENRPRLLTLTDQLDQIVLAAGGRFYPAKDSLLRPAVAQEYFGRTTMEKFRAIKDQCDPEHLIQTNFWRRVFAST